MKKNLLSLFLILLIFISCTNEKGNAASYVDNTSARAGAVIAEDLYENFVADGTVKITFNGSGWTSSFEGVANADEISIKKVENSAEDEASQGVEIQYKGKSKIKYVLSGSFTGTVFIKNKKADAAVVLNNVNISSADGSGPVLRFSAEETRTFIVVP